MPSPELDDVTAPSMSPAPLAPRSWRTLVLAILLVGLAGTLVELLLLGHYEDNWQLIPIALIGALLLALAAHGLIGSRRTVQAVRAVAVLVSASALVGIYLHYQANVEWELETTPDMHGLELFREVITGALPLLAPGAMLQFGLLGLLWTYRHPLLATTAAGDVTTTEN
jgi:hypothetical protein